MPINYKQTRTARACVTDHLLKQIRERCPEKTMAENDEVLRMAIDHAITDAATVQYVFDTGNHKPTMLVDVSGYYKDMWLVGTHNDKPGRENQTAYVTAITAKMKESNLRDGSYIESSRDEYTYQLAKAVTPRPVPTKATPPVKPVAPTPKPSLDEKERVVIVRGEAGCETFNIGTLGEAKSALTTDPSIRIFRELKTKRVVSVEFDL